MIFGHYVPNSVRFHAGFSAFWNLAGKVNKATGHFGHKTLRTRTRHFGTSSGACLKRRSRCHEFPPSQDMVRDTSKCPAPVNETRSIRPLPPASGLEGARIPCAPRLDPPLAVGGERKYVARHWKNNEVEPTAEYETPDGRSR